METLQNQGSEPSYDQHVRCDCRVKPKASTVHTSLMIRVRPPRSSAINNYALPFVKISTQISKERCALVTLHLGLRIDTVQYSKVTYKHINLMLGALQLTSHHEENHYLLMFVATSFCP